MKKLYLLLIMALIPMASFADVTIGKVYGEKTWTAYIGSTKYIFLKRGSTSFSLKCDTGFKDKGSYVISPDGSSYTSKNQVLTAIQIRLVRGKYKSQGCN
jgi:glyoxylate utilization-related uncharacterized protein